MLKIPDFLKDEPMDRADDIGDDIMEENVTND